MKVSSLVREYLEAGQQAFTVPSGSGPVVPSRASVPISPSTRWQSVGRALLRKIFEFQDDNIRDEFIMSLLAYEREASHHGKLVIEEKMITIEVSTHDLGTITEQDKEYARYCDILYKDVSYNLSYADNNELQSPAHERRLERSSTFPRG